MAKIDHTSRNMIFSQVCNTFNLPKPVFEFKFHPSRRWSIDIAWPHYKVCLEIEGGVFSKGRHTRPMGFLGDVEKYNEIAIAGWKLLRCTPSDLMKTETFNLLKRAFNNQQ